MIIYFSRSGITKKYAEAIKKITGHPIFELKEKGSGGNIIKEAFKAISKKTVDIEQMPDISKETVIYICSPIWAAQVTPVIRSFINNADLKGKIIKVLLTSGSRNDKYIENITKILEEKGCRPEKTLLFLSKESPDTLTAQLKRF